METITKTYELPSNGIFGGPTEVTLRPMTTKEEKMIYTAKDSSFIEKIVKSCIVEPKDISMSQLHSADITYLLFMLRELTFGPTYIQQTICPYCGHKQEVEINITEMTYDKLDLDEFEKIRYVDLPICEKKVKLRLISEAENNDISDYIRKLDKSNKLQDPDGYEYIFRFAKLIEEIDGEPIEDIKEAVEFLDNLNLRDFNELKKALSLIKIGINTSNVRLCSKCSEDLEVQGLTVPEFFRSF